MPAVAVSKTSFPTKMLTSPAKPKDLFESEFALRQLDGIIMNFKKFARTLHDNNSNIVICPSSKLRKSDQPLPRIQNGKKKHSVSKSLSDLSLKNVRHRRVSFADDHGLKLVSVKYLAKDHNRCTNNFLRVVSDPDVSRSCSQRCPNTCDKCITRNGFITRMPTLVQAFPDPVLDPTFLDEVQRLNVKLESVTADSRLSMASCTVRVLNRSYSKMVFARYTLDNWETYFDANADYVYGYSFGGVVKEDTDRFRFVIFLPSGFKGPSVEFAVCFRCDGKEYWDNNDQKNYLMRVEYGK